MRRRQNPGDTTVWTLGHSVLPIETFLGLLRAHGIGQIADVRRYPGSRRHPDYGAERLSAHLREAGVAYCPFPELGGRRRPRADSPHTVWRHPNFRGYADYMDSPDFAEALERLCALAAQGPTALLCSEVLWWRCHRALIADALKARGVRVLHIADAGAASEHPYTSAATLVGGRLHYGAAAANAATPAR